MWRVLQLDHKLFSYNLLLLSDVYDLRCNSVLDFFIFRGIFHYIHNVAKCDKRVNKDPCTVKCATLLLHAVGKTPSEKLHLSIHGHLSSPLLIHPSACRIGTEFQVTGRRTEEARRCNLESLLTSYCDTQVFWLCPVIMTDLKPHAHMSYWCLIGVYVCGWIWLVVFYFFCSFVFKMLGVIGPRCRPQTKLQHLFALSTFAQEV